MRYLVSSEAAVLGVEQHAGITTLQGAAVLAASGVYFFARRRWSAQAIERRTQQSLLRDPEESNLNRIATRENANWEAVQTERLTSLIQRLQQRNEADG